MSYQEAYPWNDEGHSTQREYLRNWKGMPLRTEWNASPMRMHCRTCRSCGYKWDQVDFTYRGDVLVNGEAPPVALHDRCWNCFQCETNHEQTRRFWEASDRAQSGGTAKRAPELKAMGGGK